MGWVPLSAAERPGVRHRLARRLSPPWRIQIITAHRPAAPDSGPRLHVEVIETSDLGDRSYLIHDGATAVVVDPQRDLDRILAAACEAAVGIRMVLETHVHNDYVSGGLALAREVSAEYCIAAAEQVGFDRRPLHVGDELVAGTLAIRVVAAPGHTLHHLAFVIGTAGRAQVVCTGGSLLFGTVGRTDLDSRATPDQLTRLQFQGIRALVRDLGDEVAVLPTHGFGSFCSSAAGSGAAASTVGSERRGNPVVLAASEDAFVAELLGGLTAYPRYYSRMAAINRAGAAPIDLSPPGEADAAEVRRRIAAGDWVVDLRSRRIFAGAHVLGTINVEAGDPFATHLGWVIPWGTPVVLIGSDADEVAAAQRALARIGIDRPAGASVRPVAAVGGDAPLRGYAVADMRGLASGFVAGADDILDVRRDDEWRDGHIEGARHVPLHDLGDHLDELPPTRLWVHCASGYRSMIAASVMRASGFRDVSDLIGGFGAWEQAGLPTSGPVTAGR